MANLPPQGHSIREYYDQTREKARLHYLSSNESLDKMLLFLVTGVFVLSVNVVFNGDLEFENGYFLLLSWILLSFAIISQICGYILSANQTEDQIEKLDGWYANLGDYEFMTNRPDSPFVMPRKYGKQIDYSRYVTVGSFVLALVSVLLFSSINFISMNDVSKKPVETSIPEHKGSESLLPSYTPVSQNPSQEQTPEKESAQTPVDDKD